MKALVAQARRVRPWNRDLLVDEVTEAAWAAEVVVDEAAAALVVTAAALVVLPRATSSMGR